MTTIAKSEREALCDLFLDTGPDAPTLCEGWTTRDLAAHLVVREGRPDAALGIVVPTLSWWTKRVQQHTARTPWESLVGRVRTGPWRFSPSRIGTVDAALNGLEYFVHHEDVRRAQPGWEARELPVAVQESLWSAVRTRARFNLRSAPVGVVLADPGGRRVVARSGEPSVTVTGEPAELVLLIYGRGDHALVEVSGDEPTVERFRHASFQV
jgi:uncharacterized protein (TIGR03085 family)